MLNERKLTERELDHREVVLQNLLKNKRNLVKRYGKDAEKVMYGIATKKAKTKVEGMNKEQIKELIRTRLEGIDSSPRSNTDDIDSNKSYSGGADYGSEVSATSKEDSVEQGETKPLHYSLEEGHGLDQGDIDTIQNFIDGKDIDEIPLKRVLKFIVKSNILQDKTKDLSKGKVDEAINPEVSRKVNSFIKAMAKRYDYSEQDAIFAIMTVLKQKEDVNYLDEVGGYDRKGNKEMDNDDKGLKKRPQAGISALLKSAVREKLTKKSSVEDHVDDFKKSNAKQFKGKSLKKIKQMALASFLSKQND